MDDTLADRAPAKERAYIPPPVNGDFYRITDLLDPKERAVVNRVREFMEAEVAPITPGLPVLHVNSLKSVAAPQTLTQTAPQTR